MSIAVTSTGSSPQLLTTIVPCATDPIGTRPRSSGCAQSVGVAPTPQTGMRTVRMPGASVSMMNAAVSAPVSLGVYVAVSPSEPPGASGVLSLIGSSANSLLAVSATRLAVTLTAWLPTARSVIGTVATDPGATRPNESEPAVPSHAAASNSTAIPGTTPLPTREIV